MSPPGKGEFLIPGRRILHETFPDIRDLEQKGDTGRLIALLAHRDFTIQWQAAAALGRAGGITVQPLLSALDHPSSRIRIGIIEVLGDLRDVQAVPSLLSLLSRDESNEVRFASAISLGEIGDESAMPGLLAALRDPDKYVRYGAAMSLEKNGWIPVDPEGRVWFLSAAQRWSRIPDGAGVPVGPLIHHLRDYDPGIRQQAVKILGELRDPAAHGACDLALRDSSSLVRWEAVMAFPNCNIPLMHLPRGLSRRKRERKNPFAAMILNFLFLGLGYNYLGKWWGFLLFQINLTAILIMGLMHPPVYTWYLASYVVSSIAVVHTWFSLRRLPDL